MNKLKTIGFICYIPTLILLELACILVAVFSNKFRGKYLIDRVAFLEFASSEIEEWSGIKQ